MVWWLHGYKVSYSALVLIHSYFVKWSLLWLVREHLRVNSISFPATFCTVTWWTGMNMLFLVLRWLCVTLLRKQVVVSGLTGTEVTWLILVRADNLCGAKNNIGKILLNSVIWIFCGLAFFLISTEAVYVVCSPFILSSIWCLFAKNVSDIGFVTITCTFKYMKMQHICFCSWFCFHNAKVIFSVCLSGIFCFSLFLFSLVLFYLIH